MTPTADRTSLSDALRQRILIMDGASGTQLRAQGIYEPDCGLAVSRPEVIADLHRRYLEAGADIIRTSTFRAGAEALRSSDPERFLRTAIAAACSIARSEATRCGRHIFIAGCLGPISSSSALADNIRPTLKDISEIFALQYEAFANEHVDLIAIETAYEAADTEAALEGIRLAMGKTGTNLPVMLSITPVGDSAEAQHKQIDRLSAIAEKYRIPIVGLNCGSDPATLARQISHLPSHKAIAFYPSCGLPDSDGHYDLTPAQFTAIVESLMSAGSVNIVGGCCGTTPEHIRQLASATRHFSPHHFTSL
ncbi:MAG: homocysteine S-methyltransferase family protein [Muribaculaceae bacterium]|nr:homocysteine S-methyltransferase family protein [Muribaculaceae bacterium]